MNEDRSREDSQSPFYDQLGEFSKLPPEIRFQIWIYLFRDVLKISRNKSIFPDRSIASESSVAISPLSILFCNRSLYEETSRILYENYALKLIIHIIVWRLPDEHLEFCATVNMMDTKGARRRVGSKRINLNCLDDALRLVRNFSIWRSQKCGPDICVKYNTGPSWMEYHHHYRLSDSYELELWNCVHKMVDTLKLMPNGKNIRFKRFYPINQSQEETWQLTESGVLKDWFNERFPGAPLPLQLRYCSYTDDHSDYSGPYLRIPFHHYTLLQAIESARIRQEERDISD